MSAASVPTSQKEDNTVAGVVTLVYHVGLILFLVFGLRSCETEGGGGGGNGGNGDGLMALEVAGLGNDIDGWGATAEPVAATEEVIEPVPQEPAETANVSDNSSELTTGGDRTAPKDNQPKNTTTVTPTEQPRQTSNQLNNALSGLNKGQGTTSGPGQQGDPNGQIGGKGVINGTGGGSPGSGGGTGGGNGTGNGPGNGSGSGIGVGFSLSGRAFRQRPNLSDSFSEEGQVVVEISVDKSGNVLTAIANSKASTTNSAQLYKLAEKAAKQAKFNVSDATGVQRGTITITFKLR
jgi:TonB family protein